jgi:hypothetical protein
MRSLILMTAAMVLFGCSSTLAQQVRSPLTRSAPTSGITSSAAGPTTPPAMPIPPPISVPGTIPTPGASPLGAIQFVPGTAAAISPGAAGSITACSSGPSAAAPSAILDASNAVAMTGAMSTPALPGATIPNYSFGTSIMTGTCNPATITQNIAEFFNNTAVVPIPGLATITGPTFSDATIPTAATEASGSGQSPQIIVPTPNVPSASPCAANITISPTVITDPTTLMSSSTSMTEASSPPSLFGC